MKPKATKPIVLMLALSAVSVCVPGALAEVIIQPMDAWTAASQFVSITNTIDQSALVELGSSTTSVYTSGVTDFATYVAATGHANANPGSWKSDTNFPKLVTFDLGEEFVINGFVNWQAFAPSTMNQYELYTDTDSDFNNGGTTYLGTFNTPYIYQAAINVPGHTVSFPATTTRFVHLNIISYYGGVDLTEGEFAFSAVPLNITGADHTGTTFAVTAEGLKSNGNYDLLRGSSPDAIMYVVDSILNPAAVETFYDITAPSGDAFYVVEEQ